MDAIRKVFLGDQAAAALGVTVVGHVMTSAEEIGLMVAFAIILLGAAVWAFRRQE